jgi:hypothetical protein
MRPLMLALALLTAPAASLPTAAGAQPAVTDTRPLPAAGDPETARVLSVVGSIPLAVDLAAYDLAERAFAPRVVVDYTSLWGGTPAEMAAADLMAAWRGIVPGFDATWHELSGLRASVAGDTATATAFVDGRHWIGSRLWRPVGHYDWRLARIEGRWRVTHMTFRMTQETGDRALAEEARRRAAGR